MIREKQQIVKHMHSLATQTLNGLVCYPTRYGVPSIQTNEAYAVTLLFDSWHMDTVANELVSTPSISRSYHSIQTMEIGNQSVIALLKTNRFGWIESDSLVISRNSFLSWSRYERKTKSSRERSSREKRNRKKRKPNGNKSRRDSVAQMKVWWTLSAVQSPGKRNGYHVRLAWPGNEQHSERTS